MIGIDVSYYQMKMNQRYPQTSCGHGVKNNFSERDARYCPKCETVRAERSLNKAKNDVVNAEIELKRITKMVDAHPDPWNGCISNKPEWLK